jgi:phosphoesterase RecJ-like protein
MGYVEAESLLSSAKIILIGSHINPDGDSIGSMLTLGEALQKMGKEVHLYSRDQVPSYLKFLEGSQNIKQIVPELTFDTAILVDVASAERVGKPFAQASAQAKTIVIDHHKIEAADVNIACIDESASSAGEVVYKLLKHMNLPITPSIATATYCTIAVDTGFFRYSNTTEAVFKVAAELVRQGADPWHVSRHLEESHSVARYKLMARVLDTIELGFEGKYATMEITQKMIADTHASIEDSEEFAGIPRTIASVIVSAVFRETPDGKIRASLRSKEGVDVSAVAANFGGGGHTFAAGCTIAGDMAEAKTKLNEVIAQVL